MNIKELDIAKATAFILQHLSTQGLETRQHDDFSQFDATVRKLNKRINAATREKLSAKGLSKTEIKKHPAMRKGGSSGQFNPKLGLRPNNSFWLEWLQDGRTVCVHAMRMENLGSTSVFDLWANGNQELIYGGGKTGKEHPPVAKLMTGKVAYAGDYVLHPDLRGEHLASAHNLITQFIAEMMWKPDFIYGFMANGLVSKGFNSRVGYMHCAPVGTDWIEPPDGIRPDDWLVVTDRAGIAQNAAVIARLGLDGLIYSR